MEFANLHPTFEEAKHKHSPKEKQPKYLYLISGGGAVDMQISTIFSKLEKIE